MERCFGDKSALLKHEVAYCLGQLGDARAVAKLVDVLADADNQVSVHVQSFWDSRIAAPFSISLRSP